MSGERVVLHIGLLGAGGAYLRSILDAHGEAVSAAGVRVVAADDEAVHEALTPQRDSASSGAWQRVVGEVADATEPVRLISAELLSTALDKAAREIVASFAPMQVEVVVTAQDLARTIPSAWQHAVAHGRKVTFQEYADAFTGAADDRHTREQLARQQDLVAILTRWKAVAASVRLVTVAPPGSAPGLLWERFAEAAGINADVVPADGRPPYVDGQLAFSDTELLRRVNRRVGNELAQPNYDRYVRDFLADEVLRPLGNTDPADRPTLDAKALKLATERSRQTVAAVAELCIDVVGDLADLTPDPARSESTTPSVTYPDTAVRAVAMLVRKLVEIDPAAAPSTAKSSEPTAATRVPGRKPRGGGS